MPSVTVIIANWNGKAYLPTCLEALAAQTYADFEILVIDNGSNDDSVDTIQVDWPAVRLFKLENNQGFARANNTGAKLAEGEWIAFLNNDAYPEPGWLEALVAATHVNPACAAFASRIHLVAPPELLDSTGDIYHISGNAWHRGYRQPAQEFTPPAGFVFSA
ncbi:MAG TPA: glycosyltransferase family 2 protein, partial [Anaerolineales bacterium]|nr:glycosyltransferase family 2 protein [Anaerolineales bacterium]